MWRLEQDTRKIEELARLRKEENLKFKSFLKGRNARKISLAVHRLNNEIAPKIDCTACGNCCRNLSPCLNKEDLKKLSTALDMTTDEVVEKYTETDANGLSLKHLPCIFLANNKCTIYEHRPEPCASFPHLQEEDVTGRLRNIFDNYAICPIIFNVIEQLKLEMKFESKDAEF
jgi:Fe-S-cluster containining protein